MNRAQMRTRVYDLINEASSNTHYSATVINSALEDAWKRIWKDASFNWDWVKSETVKTNGYTTVAASSTGTSLTITSPTNFADEMWVHVSDGVIYERTQIKTFDDVGAGGYVQTVSPSLLNTYASGDTVYSNHIASPTDFNKAISVFARKIVSSTNYEALLEWENEDAFFKDHPYIGDYGTPEKYCVNGTNMYIYPLPDAAWTFYIKYIKIPAVLADATEPDIPVQYQDLIVQYAVISLLAQDRGMLNNGALQHFYGEFNRGMAMMKGETRYAPADNKPLELDYP